MGSQTFHTAPRGLVRPLAVLAAVAVLLLGSPEGARVTAVVPLSYNGSTNSAISFGASANYGASAAPVWLANNVTGLNDILESPGGGFPTISAAISNNVASIGPAAYGPGVFQFLNWTGGVSGDGSTFGSGAGAIFGPSALFGLTAAPAGGVSYGIESWTASFTQNTAYNGTFGTYLSIGGSLNGVGSFVVAAAQTEVTVGAGAGATTYVLNPLILAVEETAPGVYAYVYDSASGAKILVNGLTNGFAGLAIDSYAASFAAGTPISATTTVTFFGDPASIDTISPDYSLLPGVSLPGESFGAGVPEPGSLVMGGSAMVALSFLGWMRRRARRAASSGVLRTCTRSH